MISFVGGFSYCCSNKLQLEVGMLVTIFWSEKYELSFLLAISRAFLHTTIEEVVISFHLYFNNGFYDILAG